MNFPVGYLGLKSPQRQSSERTGGARPSVRALKIIGLLAAASLLWACSAIKLAYNQAPELVYLYLDSYLDFNGAQSLKVKQELEKLHQWHRQTQLPGYVQTAQKLQTQFEGNMDAKTACGMFTDIRTRLLAVSERAEPAAAQVVGLLEPAQLRHLEKKFDKTNAEYRSDFLEGNPVKLREKRVKFAVKRAEMLYGDLDAAQLAVISKRVDESVFDAKKAYSERLRRQRDMVQTMSPLMGTPQPDKAQAAMRALLERSLVSPDTAYRNYVDTFTNENCQAFAELHNSTTPAQRRKAISKLKGYEEDLKLLAAQPV